MSIRPYTPRAQNGVVSNTTLTITIGKLEVFLNPPMHALCIIHSYPPVHATYPFLPKPPFLPVYSQVFLVCQVMLTIWMILTRTQLVLLLISNVQTALLCLPGFWPPGAWCQLPDHQMRYCTSLAMFSRQSVCVFSAGLFLQGVFSSNRALPEVPLQPTFCHYIVLSSSGRHEAPCSPGDRCISNTEHCVSVILGCVYHVCIPDFKSVYHMCVPPFSHCGVRFLRFFLDIILS